MAYGTRLSSLFGFILVCALCLSPSSSRSSHNAPRYAVDTESVFFDCAVSLFLSFLLLFFPRRLPSCFLPDACFCLHVTALHCQLYFKPCSSFSLSFSLLLYALEQLAQSLPPSPQTANATTLVKNVLQRRKVAVERPVPSGAAEQAQPSAAVLPPRQQQAVIEIQSSENEDDSSDEDKRRRRTRSARGKASQATEKEESQDDMDWAFLPPACVAAIEQGTEDLPKPRDSVRAVADTSTCTTLVTAQGDAHSSSLEGMWDGAENRLYLAEGTV